MKNVVIIGCGGHGKVIADIVLRNQDHLVGFLDDNRKENGFIGFPVLGTINDYTSFPDSEFVIAIGNADVRERIENRLRGVSFYTAIHPDAVISEINTSIGEGTVVMANAVINSGSHIGKQCIINTAAVVEHDNIIEDFVHVSVGAKLAGTVHIGRKTWIGIGATVSNNISICSDCMIGAGTVVIHNIYTIGTYVGIPAEIVWGGGST